MNLLISLINKKYFSIEDLEKYLEKVKSADFYTFEENTGPLMGDGLLAMAVFVLLMMGLVFFFYKRQKALDWCDRYLTPAFIAVWMLGFVVYDIGMYPDHSLDGTGALWSLLGVAPMAIIHAFGMFILQSDVSAIHDACFNSSWFMFFFSIAHLLAAFISMVFVIKHFGFNIVASCIRLWKTYIWVRNTENLYIFWGMNDATYYLAKDLINGNHDPDAHIVIIRVNKNDENTNKPIGMDRLFSFLSLTNNNLEKLQELQQLGCMTNSTFGSLTDMQPDGDMLLRELRLSSIVKLMNRTKNTVHMFILENDEVFNIQAVGNMKRDKSIKKFVEKGKIKFYCHARYNSVHRVIEDEPSDKNMEVRVIDSSHISVELLKQPENIHLQPVNYVDITDKATVSSAFNSLVVGFSEVGNDMVRFLFEFGAFVATNNTRDKATRSEFHCHVVDKCMSSLAGSFVVNAPTIPLSLEFDQGNAKPSVQVDAKPDEQGEGEPASKQEPLIKLYEMDCESVKFYDQVREWIHELNYIVLATENDELNVSHAVRLFRLAIREGVNTDRLRIMARVKHDENGHLSKIVEHYNRLWAANKAGGHKANQRILAKNAIIDGPITPFGSAEKVYTYDHIVNESLKESAKKFKQKYDISLYEQLKAAGQTPYPLESWDEERNNAMQLVEPYLGYSPTYSGIMRLRRAQSQNVANSLHTATKVMLAKRALKDEYNDIRVHGLTRKAGETIYTWTDHANISIDHVQQVMDTLAQTEHLRWNASHQALGYQYDSGGKDEARLLHDCLCDWEQLKDDKRSFDYNAVDVSLNEYGFNDELSTH